MPREALPGTFSCYHEERRVFFLFFFLFENVGDIFARLAVVDAVVYFPSFALSILFYSFPSLFYFIL